jgi:hypothetical protein
LVVRTDKKVPPFERVEFATWPIVIPTGKRIDLIVQLVPVDLFDLKVREALDKP